MSLVRTKNLRSTFHFRDFSNTQPTLMLTGSFPTPKKRSVIRRPT